MADTRDDATTHQYDTINGLLHPDDKPKKEEKIQLTRQPASASQTERVNTRSINRPLAPTSQENGPGNSSAVQAIGNERDQAIRYLKNLTQTDQVLFMKEVMPKSQKLFQALLGVTGLLSVNNINFTFPIFFTVFFYD